MNFDFSKSLSSIQHSVADLGNSITPFAQRTKQLLNEKLGNAEEVTSLPEEYVQLCQRIDALKSAHNFVLSVTSVYDNESYDYPPNLREALTDISRTVQERVNEVANAHSAQEAGEILVGRREQSHKPHKTLNHALSRAFDSGATAAQHAGLEPLQTALKELSVAENNLGNARIEQDETIRRVNAQYRSTLHTRLQIAAKARKTVQNCRLQLDANKSALKTARPERHAELQTDVEKAEDDFAAAIEDAITVMRNVLDIPEPVRGVVEVAQAQLAFYKQAVETLEAVLPKLDECQEQQETRYRESRGA